MATVSKDPAIKLFGRTISLPEAQFSEDSESMDNGSGMTGKANTEDCGNETSGVMDEAASLEPCKAEEAQTSLQQSCNSQVIGKTQSHHEECDDSEEPKPCKRPDKIIPCPRCNSLETKFCYFNNYNVNQPRHFCKSCQRYWTAGGTVRNVPVGAGRRRNKHLATQYRQVIVSSDGGPTTSDTETHLLSSEQSTNSCSTSSPKEMVLKFGPESPHCESAPNLLCQSQINVSSLGVGVINSDLSLQQPSYQSTPNVSVQFVPVPYWNCVPVWVAGAANMPLSVTNGDVCPPFRSSAPRIQVLGKHPRELNTGDITGDALSLPKTLRTHGLDGV